MVRDGRILALRRDPELWFKTLLAEGELYSSTFMRHTEECMTAYFRCADGLKGIGNRVMGTDNRVKGTDNCVKGVLLIIPSTKFMHVPESRSRGCPFPVRRAGSGLLVIRASTVAHSRGVHTSRYGDLSSVQHQVHRGASPVWHRLQQLARHPRAVLVGMRRQAGCVPRRNHLTGQQLSAYRLCPCDRSTHTGTLSAPREI